MSAPTKRPALTGLDLRTFKEALIQQRATFLGFLIAVLVATVVGTLASTKQYRAVALIQLMPRAGSEVDVNEVVSHDAAGYLEARDRARTQIQIIQSRSVREVVLERYADMGFDDMPPTQDGLDALGRALDAGPREDTQLVEIRVTHTDPERAAVLANLVAEVYQVSNLDQRTDAAQQTRVWLEGKTGDTKSSLDAASEKVLSFKEQHDLADVDESADGITTRMASLQAAASEANTERVLLESRIRELEKRFDAGEVEMLVGMFDDPALQAMARERASTVTAAAEVLARYGELHPEHQRTVAHLEKLEGLIATEVARNIASEKSRATTLRRQEARIEAELEQVKTELLEKQRLQEQYSTLKLEEDRLRRLYGTLGERGAEVELQASTRLNDVRIVDRAVPPTRPSKPNKLLNLAMGLIVGVGGGLGLSLLRFRIDDALVTPEDIEEHLALSMLGAIPTVDDDVPEDERVMLSVKEPRSLTAESFRGVRAVLEAYAVTGGRRMLVTSCDMGDGKTHVISGLAIAYARLGVPVLLIDADLRRPRVHTVFGLRHEPGLSNVVEGDNPFEHIRDVGIENLGVMTCGTRIDYPNELLSSPKMEQALVKLAEKYFIILIDTPPAGLVHDALAIGRNSDGIILVVRRGKTDREVSTKTVEQLERAGAKILGVVLNDVPTSKAAVKYYKAYDDGAPRRGPLKGS